MLILNRMRLKKSILIIAAAAVAAGCGGRQAEKVVEMGPEETLAAFCRALAGGEFDQAKEFCDTLTMNEYISSYMKAWDMLEKENGDVVAVAGGILAGAEVSIDETAKDGNRRIVDYTINASEGLTKKKTATVKKEEGAWKVEAITDRQ